MEAWQRVFRAFSGHFTDAGLLALRKALVEDDVRLIQGATTSPPPLMCVADFPCEGACLVGFACWQGGEDLQTVGKVEHKFAHLCNEVDTELGEAAAVRYLLNWFDETAREEMRAALLPEVDAALAARGLGFDVPERMAQTALAQARERLAAIGLLHPKAN